MIFDTDNIIKLSKVPLVSLVMRYKLPLFLLQDTYNKKCNNKVHGRSLLRFQIKNKYIWTAKIIYTSNFIPSNVLNKITTVKK